MKKLIFALLYTAFAFGANPAFANDAETILALRDGDMRKLVVHDAPKATTTATFDLADDAGEATLADYEGKYILLNFWATWCAPCRKEMPHLSALQNEFGGDMFEVLTIASGRNSPQGIKRFFEETGISNLPRHQDPKQAVSSQLGVFGLPVTLLIDPEGREIARLQGDANWHGESARTIIKALIAPES